MIIKCHDHLCPATPQGQTSTSNGPILSGEFFRPKRRGASLNRERASRRAGVHSIRYILAGLAVSAVVFAAFGELLARQLSIIDRMNGVPRELYLATSIPDLPYTLRPGVIVERQSRNSDYTVRVNRLGFRGPETSEQPPAETHRVLALGDSVVFGEGLAEADSFPIQLEQELNRSSPVSFQVVNGAVSGYNTGAEAALLREHGMKLSPQTVVLGVSLNDFGPAPVVTANGFLSSAQKERTTWTWFTNHSEFYVLLRWMITYARRGHPFQKIAREATAAKQPLGDGIWEQLDRGVAVRHQRFYRNPSGPGWEKVREGLLDIKALAAAHGARLVLVVFPESFQVTAEPAGKAAVPDDELRPQRAWLNLCKELGLECVDLQPAFQAVRERPLFMDTQHPNEAGHRIAARVVARVLLGPVGSRPPAFPS